MSFLDIRTLFTKTILKNQSPILVKCFWHKDNNPSLAIYSSSAYCFGACKKSYSSAEILERLGNGPPPQFIITNKSKKKTLNEKDLWKMTKQYQENLTSMGKGTYYQQRGINQDSIKDFKLGYTGRAFSIPIINEDRIFTIRFRRDDSFGLKGAKYWGLASNNSGVIWQPRGIYKRIIWCEGEFDCIILAQCGYFPIYAINGVGAQKIDWLGEEKAEQIKQVIVAFDNDKAAYQKSLQMIREIKDLGKEAHIVRLPYKDINELFLVKGEEGVKKYFGELE